VDIIPPPLITKNSLYISIKDPKFARKIRKWLGDNNYKNVLVVVPRFKFFIYYMRFFNWYIFGDFKMGAKNCHWSFLSLFHNFHETVIGLLFDCDTSIFCFLLGKVLYP